MKHGSVLFENFIASRGCMIPEQGELNLAFFDSTMDQQDMPWYMLLPYLT